MTEVSLLCANHPNRETTLRCNRCEKPICAQCAVLTPVGYRCRECVRGQQKVFNTSRSFDFPIAAGTAFILVGFATAVLDFLGFWGLFIAPVVGGGVAEVIRWMVRRRRHQYLPLLTAVAGALGVLAYLLYRFFPLLQWLMLGGGLEGMFLGTSLLSLIWPIAHGVLMVGSLYYRLRGIQL
ncbi:MAG: B-box zinc finger protein [Anaerolineales bacterium]|nr:B-box zinc finger protein [Anaerolineales bacterium]